MKIPKKIVKKFKKLIPTLFPSKTGWERARKRKKKFIPEFRLYSTRARKFIKKKVKKFKKLKKTLSGIIFIQNGII